MGNSQSSTGAIPIQASVNGSEGQGFDEGPPNVPQISGRSLFSHSRHSILHESWRRQSQRLDGDNDLSHDRSTQTIDDTSPPAGQEDLSMPHADQEPLVERSEQHEQHPPSLRQSTMSRLGSRLLPDWVATTLTRSGEEAPAEGQALRSRNPFNSRPDVYQRTVPASSLNRYHRVTSSWRRAPQASQARRRARGPSAAHQSLPESTQDIAEAASSPDDEEVSLRAAPRRSSSRLMRVRRSMTTSLGNVFRSSDRYESRSHNSRPRSSHITFADESDVLLHHNDTSAQAQNTDDNAGNEETDNESRNMLSSRRITQGMTSIRRLPHGLRSRSTRLIRHGEHPPLSQVLQLAAAAIAAQLHGSPGYNPESAATADGFDGSIQNFVQTLQEVASAQAGQDLDDSPAGDLPPVNFLRVFQFPNDENGSPIASIPSSRPDSSHREEVDLDNPDRSVTLVLVGVRSMPNVQDGGPSENGTLGPTLDTLLRDPFLPPANVLRNGSSGALFRRSDTRPRTQSRRHSLNNFDFPQQYESQRHSRHRTSRTASDALPTVFSDSPPGPAPPPSTPADPRSGNATPNRRPSSASAAHGAGLPDLEEDQVIQESIPATEPSTHNSHQRRRSDSEFARRPELVPGNSRRNGVYAPDRHLGGPGRSWLIYVIGTNVAPDHPAFAMPSLFTDNPSYEDMQMLSTLLGPVKPPVASQEDVEAAGGLFRVLRNPRSGLLLAEPVMNNNLPSLPLSTNDRCLICLCEYESEEEVRQINSCGHVYHRECVDEWLTTGRNSCPMCRRQGVKETAPDVPASDNSQTEAV